MYIYIYIRRRDITRAAACAHSLPIATTSTRRPMQTKEKKTKLCYTMLYYARLDYTTLEPRTSPTSGTIIY